MQSTKPLLALGARWPALHPACPLALTCRSLPLPTASLTTLRDLMDSSTYVDSHQLKLVRQLGAGAFATVALYEYTPAGGSGATRLVAVKQMRTELLDDPAEVKTFVKEVELLRKLRHK